MPKWVSEKLFVNTVMKYSSGSPRVNTCLIRSEIIRSEIRIQIKRKIAIIITDQCYK